MQHEAWPCTLMHTNYYINNQANSSCGFTAGRTALTTTRLADQSRRAFWTIEDAISSAKGVYFVADVAK